MSTIDKFIHLMNPEERIVESLGLESQANALVLF